MAGSDDSLDKSDLDETTESQDHFKSYQRSPIILELGQKVGSERSAFVRHVVGTPNENFDHSSRNPPSPVENPPRNLLTRGILDSEKNSSDVSTGIENQPPPRKKNPYSIEELLKKDETKTNSKRPRLLNTGVVQPCGIIVGKEVWRNWRQVLSVL